MLKTCKKCLVSKEATSTNFGPEKRCLDGLQARCRECERERGKIKDRRRYRENIEAERARALKYRHTKIELCRARDKVRYWANPEAARTRVRDYFQARPGRAGERYRTDMCFRLRSVLRSRLKQAVKRGFKSGSAVRDLGCTIPELRAHLEAQFKSGMTWENWSRTGWHIDHRRPLADFDLTDPEQLQQACHYTNLQPLWAAENISKGAR